MAKFFLSWDAYKSNICSGLSALQQNGEFVDMTLAADGHHVKVHQMLMSLVSPYIKDIIISTQCQHPVIFLTKVSFTTLCAILEYIYTGEVTIEKDDLPELIQAGRELGINGLKDMTYKLNSEGISQAIRAGNDKGHSLSKTSQETEDQMSDTETTLAEAMHMEQAGEYHQDDESIADQSEVLGTENENSEDTYEVKSVLTSKTGLNTQIQYCISYGGSLHMILNRYIYYLKYKSRKGKGGHRTWRCSDNCNPRVRCPATVTTQGEAVIKRKHAHNHPFHDRAILRRMRKSGVYTTAIDDNELQELVKNKGKQKPPAAVQNKKTKDK